MCGKKSVVRIIAYCITAFLLVGIPFGYLLKADKESVQVDILFLGDSLIGRCRDESSVPYLVGQALGKSTFNGAFGGTTMTWYPNEKSDYYQKYGLNFPALANALSTGDFGVQKSLESYEPATEDFPQVIDTLARLDVEHLEIVVLEYGTNDFFAEIAIEGEVAERTLGGSFEMGISTLKERFPHLRIVMVGPTYNWHYQTVDDSEALKFTGEKLKFYSEAIGNLCEEYQVEYIDLYDLYDHTDNMHVYTEDSVHPNSYGRELIAKQIAGYLSK